KILQNFSGRHFSPDILKAFVKMLGVYPIGTMVRLSTNEIAIVTKINPETPAEPWVKVVYDTDGRALPAPYEANLSYEGEKKRTIAVTVNPTTVDIDLRAFFEKEAG
ncbi:MAG: hypothetical protein HZB83_02350, partial [Deltaproteobacteria bacterium]|nr:hypothetical protein [Deltaproteobacteria bacterium]